jgi:hypothetical protein
VPGIVEGRRDSRQDLQCLLVLNGAEERDGALHVLDGVERRAGHGLRLRLGAADLRRQIALVGLDRGILLRPFRGGIGLRMAAPPARLGLALELGGVTKDDLRKVQGAAGGVDRPCVAGLHERRDPPAMVEVGVGQE